jgi:hypothetical protein
VSQFTLLASTKKGSKPDFHGAMGGEDAKRLYQHFYRKVQEGYAADRVKDGVFQAMMQVALVNDGPVGACLMPSCFPAENADCQQGYTRGIDDAKAGWPRQEGERRR